MFDTTTQTTSAPSFEGLRAELVTLESRGAQIGAELQSARQRADSAQNAFIEGQGRAEMMETSAEILALKGAAEAIEARIAAKRVQVEAAKVEELRSLRVEEARAHASRFLVLRAEVESDAHEIMALLESRGAQIVARIDAATEAARDFRLCHQSIENPPDVFETSDGSIGAAKIESDGAAPILAWIYRNATEKHAAKEAFEALYKGARRDQETQWLRSFHDRAALSPDATQIAQNVARSREPARPFTEDEQRQEEARQWRLNAQQGTPENGGRARQEASHSGEPMQAAIDRESEELHAAAERRVRAEMEAAGA